MIYVEFMTVRLFSHRLIVLILTLNQRARVFIEEVTQCGFKNQVSQEVLQSLIDRSSSGLRKRYLRAASKDSEDRFEHIFKSMRSAVLAVAHAEDLTNVLPHFIKWVDD